MAKPVKLRRRRLLDQAEPESFSSLTPLLQRICIARGILSDAELEFSLKQLLPVSALAHVDQAAELLADVIHRQASILIVGDFDADGATATAVGFRALRLMGHENVDYLVPNRFEYGYGLTPEIVADAQRFNPDLIITVDNGISSVDGVRAAKDAGIQVLVTDHHLPGKDLPAADVIVNPNLPDDDFPSKALAGVGVIFYVMLALKRHLQEGQYFAQQSIQAPNLLSLLDLVALGTVADVVTLDSNNRILVEQGLRRVRSGQCSVGILALFEVAGRNPARAVAADFGFVCGPRLNAAGRLDDMSLGIACLLSESPDEARQLAVTLDDLNQERRAIENSMKAEAMQALQGLELGNNTEQLPAVLCLYNESWHQGVIGILAARIKEVYHRPVIAFAPADSDDEIKGSARSIPGIHMRDLLDEVATQHPGLLNKFGGHAMAAGLTLKVALLDDFQQAINQIVTKFDDDIFYEVHYSDGELESDDFSLQTAEALRNTIPWGQQCPAPQFDGKFIIKHKKLLKEAHLRLDLLPVSDSNADCSRIIPAIAFNINPQQWPEAESEVHILYRLDVNEFRGVLTPQIIIEKLLAGSVTFV